MTKIEWTEKSWNPIVGCTVKSPGCKHCYAMGMAYRLEAMGPKADGSGNIHLDHYTGTTELSRKGKPVWTGKLGFNEKAWLEPLRRKKPTMYFVNSMGDLFHEDCPAEWIDRVFAVMALAPQHTFQVLTKRSARMREYFESGLGRLADAIVRFRRELGDHDVVIPLPHIRPGASWFPFPNVWLGVSVEDQTRADERVPDLLATPAAVRWLSCEPLLGPVDLTYISADKPGLTNGQEQWNALDNVEARHASNEGGCDGVIDWVVVGGESGSRARPMHPDWARSLRDQCETAGVPFFFKQWGEFASEGPAATRWAVALDGTYCSLTGKNLPDRVPIRGTSTVYRVGKKSAGRLLDGVTHDGMPEIEGYVSNI